MIFDVEILINERYVLCYNMILLSIYEESTFSVRVTNENKLTYAFGLLLQFHFYADMDFGYEASEIFFTYQNGIRVMSEYYPSRFYSVSAEAPVLRRKASMILWYMLKHTVHSSS